MSPTAHVPDELRIRPFRGRDAVQAGLLTRTQLEAACWRQVLHGVYCHVDVPDSVVVRAAAARLVLPEQAAVSGRAAAWMHGVDILGRDARLQATVPRGVHLRRRRELELREAELPDTDVTEIAGVRVTTPLRTAFDLARREPLVEAVMAVDALAHAELVDLAELLPYATEHRGWRGVRQVAVVAGHADPLAESPMESRTRMVLVLGGLPRPECQIEVRTDSGLFVARIDMGYRRARLGIEFDGGYHGDPAVKRADDVRANRLRACGWSLLRYDTTAVLRYPRTVVGQVAAALQSAA